MEAVEAYVARLGQALVGPRRTKAELLREVRDGLTDATEAYQRGGLSELEAQAKAVADFGPVAELAPEYQHELAAAQGRRTALLTGLILAPQHLVWAVVGHDASRDPAWHPGPGYVLLSSGVELLGGISLGLALVLLLGLTRYGRLARPTGLFALALAPLVGSLGVVLTLLGPVPPLSPYGLPWTFAFLLAPLALLGHSAWRCLATSRRVAARSLGASPSR
jgi:hypothetical protein